jgi:voltage-gated potassium channel
MLYGSLLKPIMLLTGLTLVGTVGYIIIGDYSLLDALYMTVITVGTVGFGEVVPLDAAGKLFTIFLIISSLGLVAYYISLLTHIIIDGEWRRQYQQFQLILKLNRMEDHVIVCGYGRNGRQACEVLRQNHIPYVVIEQRESNLEDAGGEVDLLLSGDATKDEILIEAGIKKAKALISALPNDADNLFVVLTARQLNPGLTIISRASDDHSIKKLKIAGANNVIMPDKLGGGHMATLVLIPDVQEFISMLSTQHNERFQITEVEATDNFNLGELNLWHTTGCTVLGIKQNDGKYRRNPQPDYILLNGERLIVMGSKEQIEVVRKVIG